MNFTRALSTKFNYQLNKELGITDFKNSARLNVGRVMTCVLGLVVDRELEIKNFKPVDYYKIDAVCGGEDKNGKQAEFTAHFKAIEKSSYYEKSDLYNDTGFLKEEKAKELLAVLAKKMMLTVEKIEEKEESKGAPLLFSLAELQSECTKRFKISPDKTLEIAQSLYEKKMTTYPRTDARVLSTAVCMEIKTNLDGLMEASAEYAPIINEIIKSVTYKRIDSTRYCDDKKITDHYAIIPTGEGKKDQLDGLEEAVYDLITRRFLSIFMPPAKYISTKAELKHDCGERFTYSSKTLIEDGYLKVSGKPKEDKEGKEEDSKVHVILKKGDTVTAGFKIISSQTQPPKRYTSGSMILAMENAGNLIEDEELRAQIKGSGIGTSATRAEVIKKLVEDVHHLKLDKKTQILTPTEIGFGVYGIVKVNTPKLLSPKLTASWEKGLSQIESGETTYAGYLKVLNKFVTDTVEDIKKKEAEQGEYKKVESREIGVCPICNSPLLESEKAVYCKMRKKDKEKGCHFIFSKTLGGKPLPNEQIEKLIRGENTDLLTDIPKKDGKGTYDAYIILDKDGRASIKYPSEETGLICPKCGNAMEKGKFSYGCSCGMSIYHTMGGRFMTEEEMSQLFTDMMIGPISGFTTKEGKPYSAYILFNGKDAFQVKSVISGRNITREEVLSILENGKTKKLDGFKSAKGEFSAILKLSKKGYVEFEFPDSGKEGAAKKSLKGGKSAAKGSKTYARKTSRKKTR